MLISESNKTMIAAAPLTWQNHSGATVYTNPLNAGNCTSISLILGISG